MHRSATVRLDRLAEVRPGSHSDATVRLVCGTELHLSRRYRDKVHAYLAR